MPDIPPGFIPIAIVAVIALGAWGLWCRLNGDSDG